MSERTELNLIQEVIARVMKGSSYSYEEDLQILQNALRDGKLILKVGTRSIGIKGDVANSQITSGNSNIVLTGATAQNINIFLEKTANSTNTLPIENKPRRRTQTPDSPRLVGFLVDVSESMISSIKNRSDKQLNRFDNFRDSLCKAVNRVKDLPNEAKNSQRFFALGFDFGSFMAYVLGDSGKKVRDLLVLSSTSDSTVSLKQLVEDWEEYEKNIDKMLWRMGGGTPMKQAFLVAEERFETELGKPPYNNQPILFILSDGVPTDASANEVALIANGLKEKGILIISCYLTNNDIVKSRYLCSESLLEWEEGAKLMFECASIVELSSPPYEYFIENKWKIQSQEKSRLFTQINKTGNLSEYTEVINSFLNQEYS